MVFIDGFSFGLVEHESLYNLSEISLEFVFNKREGKKVSKLDLGKDFLFFVLVFHFVNLLNRRIDNFFIFPILYKETVYKSILICS